LKADELAQDIANLRRVNGNLGPNSYVLKRKTRRNTAPCAARKPFRTIPTGRRVMNCWSRCNPPTAIMWAGSSWTIRATSPESPRRDVEDGTAGRRSAVTIGNTALHRQLCAPKNWPPSGSWSRASPTNSTTRWPPSSVIPNCWAMNPGGAVRQKLDKLTREALRMKRIIENLLRFARQNSLEKKSSNLEALLQDVLALPRIPHSQAGSGHRPRH